MLVFWLLLTAGLSGFNVHAESSSTTTTSTSIVVPSSSPELYNGPLRPQVHFSPPQGFMNDPNGMFRDEDGLWHLYYQYNPTATVAGNQHWGHATSSDLYHWENQPIALSPPTPTDYVFSGSAVVDSNNTSGFFPNQTNGVVAIYTLAGKVQNQNIAYSLDGGYTFIPYSSNPVIDINSTEFRDPKVIWHAPTQRWVMVIAFASEFSIGIYTSPNLREWAHVSNFSNAGLLGLQYECPNLVEMPMYSSSDLSEPVTTMYLMLISINPGAPLGGSISQYFPGYFNGTHFTAVDAATRLTDFAKDNYAGQFFYGLPASTPQVSIAWASNWQYTNVVPTGETEGWRSAMTVPRLNYLRNVSRQAYDLISVPYDLTSILANPSLVSNKTASNTTILHDLSPSNSPFHLQLNLTSIPTSAPSGSLNITLFSSVSGESISLGQSLSTGDFFINRGNTYGFDNPFFTDKFSTSLLFNPSTASTLAEYTLELIFDRSIFEVFLQGGEKVGTVTVYPEYKMDTLIVKTADLNTGISMALEVRSLEETWPTSSTSFMTDPSWLEDEASTTFASNISQTSINNSRRDKDDQTEKWDETGDSLEEK